jgi:hypothetical protein
MQVKTDTWVAYRLGPIDNGWGHLSSFANAFRAILAAHDEYECGGNPNQPIMEFLDAWEHAKSLATEAGWDGDFRHPPSVFWIPSAGIYAEFTYAFAFKQDKGGATFIVSPVELPWLADNAEAVDE